jgi:biotin transport system substrate-specific component
MFQQQRTYPTLINSLWPTRESSQRFIRSLALALAGTALLTLSAKIQVPFYPVPMTMQTYILLVLGMAYGWRLGGAMVLLYLAEGAAGLPVFAGTPAKGIGLAYMAGSTGGYLVGFVLAALLCGWLAERGWDRHLLSTAVAMTAGTALIFIPGLLWLGVLFGWDKPIVAWGLIPFLPGAVAKIALAMFTLPLAWRAVGRK